MASIGHHREGTNDFVATLACVSLYASFLSAPAYAEESAALKLVRNVQSLQSQYGSYAPQVLPPLVELGTLYGSGQCEHALEILELALDISHRAEGLLNPQQLEIYSTLMNCYITLDLPGELAKAQRYVTLINETQYGRKDPRLLRALEEGAKRYEEAGLYFSARRLHDKALDIARSLAGDKDLSLVAPLRGIARAYRLEYTFGIAFADMADPAYNVSTLRSYMAEHARLDTIGQKSLERAVNILRKHPEARSERIETLVELGDWHQIAGHHRHAVSVYREAWREAYAADAPDTDVFKMATPLQFRARNSVPLRRPPPEEAGMRKYTIDLVYDVTRDGKPKGVKVLESNAPGWLEDKAVTDLRELRHRPKFQDGEPVADEGLQYRRNIFARASQRD
jgi:hypothetical protein